MATVCSVFGYSKREVQSPHPRLLEAALVGSPPACRDSPASRLPSRAGITAESGEKREPQNAGSPG